MEVFPNIPLGSTVSFETYVSSVIPNQYKQVKMLAVIDFDTAKQWVDPLALHENIYPTLPEGSLDAPEDYYYLKVKLLNGKIDVIGLPWIQADSVVMLGSGTLTITIDNITSDQVPQVLEALSANGFNTTSSSMS